MLFLLQAMMGIVTVLAVAGAYQLARGLDASLTMQAGAARMPQGAAHDIA